MDPGDYVKVKCVASGHPHERYNFWPLLQFGISLGANSLNVLMYISYIYY